MLEFFLKNCRKRQEKTGVPCRKPVSGKIRSVFICRHDPICRQDSGSVTRILQDLCLQDLHFLSTTSMRCLAAATTRLNAVRARALAGFSTAFFGSLIPQKGWYRLRDQHSLRSMVQMPGMPKRSCDGSSERICNRILSMYNKMWDGFSLNPSIQFRRPFISACPLIPARTSIRAFNLYIFAKEPD